MPNFKNLISSLFIALVPLLVSSFFFLQIVSKDKSMQEKFKNVLGASVTEFNSNFSTPEEKTNFLAGILDSILKINDNGTTGFFNKIKLAGRVEEPVLFDLDEDQAYLWLSQGKTKIYLSAFGEDKIEILTDKFFNRDLSFKKDLNIGRNLTVNQDAYIFGGMNLTGNFSGSSATLSSALITGNFSTNTATIATAYISGDLSIDGNLSGTTATLSSALITGNFSTNTATIATAYISGDLSIDGNLSGTTATLSSALITGNLKVNQNIILSSTSTLSGAYFSSPLSSKTFYFSNSTISTSDIFTTRIGLSTNRVNQGYFTYISTQDQTVSNNLIVLNLLSTLDLNVSGNFSGGTATLATLNVNGFFSAGSSSLGTTTINGNLSANTATIANGYISGGLYSYIFSAANASFTTLNAGSFSATSGFFTNMGVTTNFSAANVGVATALSAANARFTTLNAGSFSISGNFATSITSTISTSYLSTPYKDANNTPTLEALTSSFLIRNTNSFKSAVLTLMNDYPESAQTGYISFKGKGNWANNSGEISYTHWQNSSQTYNSPIGEYTFNNPNFGAFNFVTTITGPAGYSGPDNKRTPQQVFSAIDGYNVEYINASSQYIKFSAASININNNTFASDVIRLNSTLAVAFISTPDVSVSSVPRVRIGSNTVSIGTGPTISDIRLKSNLQNIENPIEAIKTLHPISYNYKNFANFDETDPTRQIGFIAQEVETIYPYLVANDAIEINGQRYKGLDYSRLTALLTAGIQNQQIQIDGLSDAIGNLNIGEMQSLYDNFNTALENLSMSTEDGRLVVNSGLTVTGQALFNSANFTGNVKVGQVKIDSLENDINVDASTCVDMDGNLNSTNCDNNKLNIMKNKAGNVEMFDGKVKFRPNGEVLGEKVQAKTFKNNNTTAPSGSDSCNSGEFKFAEESGNAYIFYCTSDSKWVRSELSNY